MVSDITEIRKMATDLRKEKKAERR